MRPANEPIIVSYRGIAPLLEGIDRPTADEISAVRESGPPVLDTISVERGGGVALAGDADLVRGLDEFTLQSMWSGLEQAISEIARADKTPGVLFAPDHAASSLLLSFLSSRAADLEHLEPVRGGGYEVKFDERDLKGWVGSFFRDWYKHIISKRPFIPGPAKPSTIPNTSRIAILGDWGTGLYGAPIAANAIASARPSFDIGIHLGDIYYAGNKSEVGPRFLSHWPKLATSFALNANHEMYSGGEGYFDQVLPAFNQKASNIALQNDHFLIIGLDTGYSEHELAPAQIEWLEQLVAQADSRKLVLLSHHQPFSTFEKQGGQLVQNVQELLNSRRILAWYWGHEHRCQLYTKHPKWQVWGRLVGHSGFPYFRQDLAAYPIQRTNADGTTWRSVAATESAPASTILDGVNPYVIDAPARYGPQGFASITLDGAKMLERVHSADGSVLHELELT